MKRWREQRYQKFMRLCDVKPKETILDVGAGGGGALERFNDTNPIVALDLNPRNTDWLSRSNVTVEVGDATLLPFPDGSFPVAFSNSVIEHIPAERREAFAREIQRVSARYFVQTPNRYFPIEPHYQFPFFQFLPRRAQRWLNGHFTLGWRDRGIWEDTRLLSTRELRHLFPDAEIHRERLLGLTKSLMAVQRGASANGGPTAAAARRASSQGPVGQRTANGTETGSAR